MLWGARFTPSRGETTARPSDPIPLSGMAPLPSQVVGAEDRAVPADSLVPFARFDHAPEADAHRAAHVLLHRQLDRLFRADGAGHAVPSRPGQPRDGFEH